MRSETSYLVEVQPMSSLSRVLLLVQKDKERGMEREDGAVQIEPKTRREQNNKNQGQKIKKLVATLRHCAAFESRACQVNR